MNIVHGETIELSKGRDREAHDSAVYLAKSFNESMGWHSQNTVVIAGREASLLTLLLAGGKLKELSGAEITGLFA